jgi:hypothetical protein
MVLLVFLVLPSIVVTSAQLQLPDSASYGGKEYFTKVSAGVDENTKGADAVVKVVKNVVKGLKLLLLPLITALMIYIGVRIMFAQGNEDEIKKFTSYFLYVVIGVAFIAIADKASDIFTLGGFAEGSETFLGDQSYVEQGQQVRAILNSFVMFARFALGGIAVFFSVKSGALIIFANGSEDEVTKQKEVFLWGFVGFILIMVSTTLINNVVFPLDDQTGAVATSASEGVKLVVSLINLLLGLLGGLSIISLVAGGVMYSASAGSTERSGKASKIIYGSLLGLIIAYSSYTIVAEFIPTSREVGSSTPVLQIEPSTIEERGIRAPSSSATQSQPSGDANGGSSGSASTPQNIPNDNTSN